MTMAESSRAAAFLDRDGVLNEDTGYIGSTDRLVLVEGAAKAVRRLNELGLLVLVVTNQSGVARGYFSEDDVAEVHVSLRKMIAVDAARIDDFRHCPHHPDGKIEKYRLTCVCRKPKPGLILSLASDHAVDLRRSFMIGDKKTDMQAAAAAGVDGYLFSGGSLLDFVEDVLADRRAKSDERCLLPAID